MIINRYISARVIKSALGIFGLMLFCVLLVQLLGRFDQVVAGRMPLGIAMQLLWLQLPFLIGFLLPFAFFFSVILVFGQMHFDNEMIVLAGSGFSPWRCFRVLIPLLCLVSVPIVLCVAILQPGAELRAQHLAHRTSISNFLDSIQAKRFEPLHAARMVFYTESVSKDHQTYGRIFLAKQAKSIKKQSPGYDVLTAKSAKRVWRDHLKHPGEFLEFNHGYFTQGVPGALNFKRVKFDVLGIRLSTLTQNSEIKTRMAQQALPTLWAQSDQASARIELQWRFAFVVALWILTLIAIPMSHLPPRKDRYARLLPALMVYTVYMNVLFVNRGWLHSGKVPELFGFWWVHALALLLGLILMFRPRIQCHTRRYAQRWRAT